MKVNKRTIKMFNLRDISIKRKLTIIIMVTSEIALVLACIAFIIYDRITIKASMAHDLTILAEIIGDNCNAALGFNRPEDANAVLASLKAKEHIIAACIYSSNGEVFVDYQRQQEKVEFIPPEPEPPGYRFEEAHLVVFRRINLNNEEIGTIFIQAALEEIDNRSAQFIAIISIFLIFTSGVVFIITRKLQKLISEPIMHLAEVARKVTRHKDYSVRAQQNSDDEIGFLTKSFNEMLKQIQDQAAALQKTHDDLKIHAQELQSELTDHMLTEMQLKRSLKEKEVLLKEIHHRVKNNLQIISSLIYLQSKNIQDEGTLQLFQDSQNRVKSMALIHEKLYQSKDLARIDFDEYIKSLVNHLFYSYRINLATIKPQIDIDDISLSIDTAICCGIIINELVSNSLKHAFPAGKKGKIEIKLQRKYQNEYILVVKDNGIGLPENVDFKHTKSLGLQLVCNLTDQLNGLVELERNSGTTFRITFR